MNSFTSCGGVSNNIYEINHRITIPKGIIVNYDNRSVLLECNREDVESIIGHNISIKTCFCGCVFVKKKIEYVIYDHDDQLASLLRKVINIPNIPHKTLYRFHIGECHIWGSIFIYSSLQQKVCERCIKFKKSS